MSTTPIQPASKKSNLLWWVLGFVGVAAAFATVCGLLLASFFVRGVRVNPTAQQVEVSTPAGQLTLRGGTSKDLGLPVCPGATLVESGGSLEFTTSQDEKVGVTGVHYHTADSLDKVDAWYRTHLGSEFVREGPGKKAATVHGHGVTISSMDIAFIADKDDLVRMVVLERRGTGVEIALVRMGQQEAQ